MDIKKFKGDFFIKNKKAALAGFLLAAVMGISVGYAAVATVLDFTGTITVTKEAATNAFDTDIYFDSIVGAPTNCTAQINSDNNDKITMTVEGLSAVGDTATVTAKIVNAGSLDATIKVRSSNLTGMNPEYFDLTTDWGSATKDLAAGGSIEITITITLKTPATDLTTASLAVELEADSIDA